MNRDQIVEICPPSIQTSKVGIQRQLVIPKEKDPSTIPYEVTKAGMKLPLKHPPRPLLERLARELRHRLGLCLFNIDMIREHGTKDVFYVIYINYFPGYGKMPDYEHEFTDFLLSLVQSKCKKKLTT